MVSDFSVNNDGKNTNTHLFEIDGLLTLINFNLNSDVSNDDY